MPARFVNIDRDTPLPLRPNLRDWVRANHLCLFLVDAVEELNLHQVKVNERGTGSEQYPPRMLLSLLIYSYATGVFGSRRIEQSTYESVPVRVLCADTHPDHDTICTFRRENKELVREAFVKVLEMAQNLKFLKVGQITVAVDGTKVLANASKHSAVSYQRAGERIEPLEMEVAQLLSQAEQADSTPLEEGTKSNLNSLTLSFTKTDAGGFRMSRPASKYPQRLWSIRNAISVLRIVSPTAC